MRIATDSIFSNVLRNIQRNQVDLDRLNQQISSGLQFRFPHEEPVKALQSMQIRSDILRNDKYNDNIVNARSIMEATDAALENANELLQRVRELTIQAANVTLNASDRAAIGFEVDQLLEEMVSIGNSTFQGKFIFGGSETLDAGFNENPFVVQKKGDRIVKVIYKGDQRERRREISEGRYLSAGIPGNRVFAGANHAVTMGLSSITSATTDDGVEKGVSVGAKTGKDATLDSVLGVRTGYFRIDGREIYYDTESDSLQDLADRVNQANLEVRASVVTVGSSFRLKLESTNPHQMELIDIDRTSSTTAVEGLLADLDILDASSYTATDPNHPNNIDGSAIESNVSVFQALINVRDDLDVKVGVTNPDFVKRYGRDSNGDGVGDITVSAESAILMAPSRIGGSSLANLDAALDNLLANRAVLGSRLNRLEATEGRNTDFGQNLTQTLQKVEDLDFSKALIEFQQQQVTQQAALSTGARIFSLTLLDFL